MPVNKEEVFVKVAQHLMKQQTKSVAPSGFKAENGNDILDCAYRGQNGAKCAIGSLILDNLYTPECEATCTIRQNTLAQELVAKSLGVEKLEPEVVNLLADLQACHDRLQVETWRFELKKIAKRHSLTVPAFLR